MTSRKLETQCWSTQHKIFCILHFVIGKRNILVFYPDELHSEWQAFSGRKPHAVDLFSLVRLLQHVPQLSFLDILSGTLQPATQQPHLPFQHNTLW